MTKSDAKNFYGTNITEPTVPRTSIGNFLLRKMIPDALPLLVPEPNHSTFISDRQQSAILR